ncbi:hypothetical protein VB776_04245 [Arcicella sp. DC2W]|uniref:Uncharacterized protein n=1 Tax=Arcicella gelida TaxID=2984195 RepID=A0ABU5S0V4_9BACT|nr:hypothetical protein [Arcicella sp. DC2W]MEA5402112.1 hypothetical protein [Arcicella sp. DC2W]
MGNPSKKGATKLKNQAPTVQISKRSSILFELDNSSNVNEVHDVNIELENIDFLIAHKVNVYDNVELILKNNIYEAFSNKDKIGDIPSNYTPLLMMANKNKGRIISISLDKIIKVVIRVQIKFPN